MESTIINFIKSPIGIVVFVIIIVFIGSALYLTLSAEPNQCKLITYDTTFKKIAHKSYLNWTDDDRNTAIKILNNDKILFANGKNSSAQTNKDLADKLVPCLH